MKVKFILRKKEFEVELKDNITVGKAIKKLELLPEGYLAVRNGELLVEQDILRDNDLIKLVPVVSGGNQ